MVCSGTAQGWLADFGMPKIAECSVQRAGALVHGARSDRRMQQVGAHVIGVGEVTPLAKGPRGWREGSEVDTTDNRRVLWARSSAEELASVLALVRTGLFLEELFNLREVGFRNMHLLHLNSRFCREDSASKALLDVPHAVAHQRPLE